MRTTGPACVVTYERETKEATLKGWTGSQMTDKARAHCACSQFDTGLVDAVVAYTAAKKHARAFADARTGPVRPGEEPTA